MKTPFHTTQMKHGGPIRIIHTDDGRQVAMLKLRQSKAGELQQIRDLIEGKVDG